MQAVSRLDPAILAAFDDYLRDHPILAQGYYLPHMKQPATAPAYIPIVPGADARPLACWYNVEKAVDAKLGKARFGWALWPKLIAGDSAYVAQHHAVLETPSGDLVDITPQDLCYDGEMTLFMSDPNAGFEYGSGLRAPLLGYLPGADIEFVWLGTKDQAVHVPGAWVSRFDNLRLLKADE